MSKERFKYNILINQKAIVDNNIDIALDEAVILSYLMDLKASSSMETMIDYGKEWMWVAHGKVIKDLPILGIKTTQSILNKINRLIELGFVERHNGSLRTRRSYYRLTSKCSLVIFSEPKESTTKENMEMSELQRKIGSNSKESFGDTPKEILEDYSINDYSINDYSFKKNKPKKENQSSSESVQDEKKKEKKSSVQKKKKFGKAEFKQILLEHGANEQHIDDWFVARDVHKAPYTRTALNGVLNECSRNNFEVSKAIKYLAENGYRGFKYAWYLNSKGKTNQQPKTDYSNFRHNR